MTTSSSVATAPSAEASLVKAMGVRALAATTFNIMIGGGIFLLPAAAAAGVGAAAPLVYLACSAAMGLIVLCFAQAGSRVELSGGPYAYVEVAFGPFAGFIAGVLLWLVATLATSAVASGFAASVGVLWTPSAAPVARAILLALLFILLATINIRGIEHGSRLLEILTVAKLIPLLLLVVVGALLVRPEHLSLTELPDAGRFGRTAILLMFAFAGLESALMPSGEVRDPARTVPRALFLTMAAVTALYVAVQVVAQGILGPQLASAEDAPLAAAAATFAGAAGATIMLIGASVSTFGNVSGMILATPRALFAFARDGLLPPAMASVHPRYRTPHVAIAIQAAIVWLLATTGSFTRLFVLATVSVLVLYLLCCVASWELGRRDVRAGGIPFRIPGGALVPVLAVLVILWLLSSATRREVGAVAGVTLMASIVYAVRAMRRKQLLADRP